MCSVSPILTHRIDVIRAIYMALGTSFPAFVRSLDFEPQIRRLRVRTQIPSMIRLIAGLQTEFAGGVAVMIRGALYLRVSTSANKRDDDAPGSPKRQASRLTERGSFSLQPRVRAPTAGRQPLPRHPGRSTNWCILKHEHRSHWATWLMGDIQRETNRCLRQFCPSGTCSRLHSGILRSPLGC